MSKMIGCNVCSNTIPEAGAFAWAEGNDSGWIHAEGHSSAHDVRRMGQRTLDHDFCSATCAAEYFGRFARQDGKPTTRLDSAARVE